MKPHPITELHLANHLPSDRALLLERIRYMSPREISPDTFRITSQLPGDLLGTEFSEGMSDDAELTVRKLPLD